MRLLRSVVFAAGCGPLGALAVNGLGLIGYGTESSAMGGADTAVARDTTALNSNPAGLAQLTRPSFDGFLTIGWVGSSHLDGYGNQRHVDNDIVPAGGLGFARPAAAGRLVWGLGVFAQGGAGAVYKALRTPYGTTDELSTQVAIVRFSPGLAWRAGDQLSLGVALPLNVIAVEQNVFPGTSSVDPDDPGRPFFGLKLKHARGVRLGLRLGAMWKPSARWTLGASYSPKTRLDAKGGEAQLNMSAAGLGRVRYSDARVEGFALARELALGVAWQATPSTLLSLKVAHLDWSDALRSLRLRLSDPDNPAARAQISQEARVAWRDQWVVALGLAYRHSDRLTLYAGFNYGRSPAPPETLSPLLAAIGARHLTGGFAWRVSEGWVVKGALEQQLRERVAYDNPNAPLGADAEERSRYLMVHLMLSRTW